MESNEHVLLVTGIEQKMEKPYTYSSLHEAVFHAVEGTKENPAKIY